MRPKILIIDAHRNEQVLWEEILMNFLDKGGEVLFVHDREKGKQIYLQELPLLIFIDPSTISLDFVKEWKKPECHVVEILNRPLLASVKKQAIGRPLIEQEVLEKVAEVFSLPFPSSAPMPPM